jgi:hypothetical protein
VRKAFLVLVACVAVGLGGCGGSEDSVSTGSSTSEATPTPSTAQTEDKNTAAQDQDKGKANKSPTAKGEGSPAKEGNKDSSSSHPKPVVKPPAISKAPVAGSKAPAPGVKTVPDGDNSVQEYGVEADESSRREAAIALQAYLDARAQEDWGTACSLLAKRPTEQLEKLAGQSQADCAEVLKATAKGTSSQPGSAITEVLSFRGEGDISGNPSYLIFEGPPGGTLFSMPMYLQGGAWKVGLAQPSELPV